jgi:thymidylate kinase
VRLGKSQAVDLIRDALADYLAEAAETLAPTGAGREVAESVVQGVERIRQPGATIALPGGPLVNLRDLARAALPAGAQFGIFLADRVLQNQEALRLLESSSLVIQERGAFSTYVYQCVMGGISPSLFTSVTEAITPHRPDLLILLSPGRAATKDAKAYSNPPLHILRLCASNFALISTDGLDSKQVAAAVVEAMSGQRLVLPLDR